MKVKIALFASGRGSNARVLLEAMRDGWIAGEPVLLITDRECGAEELATEFNFLHRRIVPGEFTRYTDWQTAITKAVLDNGAELVALCGFLRLIPAELCRAMPNRILNIHPAPLPEFGGKGMWGHHVHEAIITAGIKWSGPTVHFVNEEYDKGDILDHVPVPVLDDDTPETLATRVLQVEHRLYPIVMALIVSNIISAKS